MKKSLSILAVCLGFSVISLVSCAPKMYNFSIEISGPGYNAIDVIGTEEGTYEEGYLISVNVIIAPGSNVNFEGFYINDELVSDSSNYSFELTCDTVLVAKYDYATSSEDDNTPEEIKTNAVYQHKWQKDELKKDGGTTDNINGLLWNYGTSNYIGYDTSSYDRGLQIGSKNNPQKTPWKIETSIPEGVYVTGYSLELANAKGGSGNYNVKFGNYEKTNDFAYDEPTTISDSNLEEKTTSFSLTLQSNDIAMYIRSFEIYFYIPSDVDFKVAKDDGEDDEVVSPENPDVSTNRPETKYKPIAVEEYYKDINFNLTSAELFGELSDKISTNITSYTYGDARYILEYTDQIVGDSKHLYSLFDGDTLNASWDYGATWNREHVWPKSKLGVSDLSNNDQNIATDLMNLRASCSNANSSHGNRYYGENSNSTDFFPNIKSGLDGTHNYGGDHRGDVARICFYMALRYDDVVSLSDSPSGSYQMGYLSTLLKWNEEDPVDSFEIQRNNRIYEYQGNRNPFVDYQELADILF